MHDLSRSGHRFGRCAGSGQHGVAGGDRPGGAVRLVGDRQLQRPADRRLVGVPAVPRQLRRQRAEFVRAAPATRRPGRRASPAATTHRTALRRAPPATVGAAARARPCDPAERRWPGRARPSERAGHRARRSPPATSPSTHDTSSWPLELPSHGSTSWRTARSTSSSSRSASVGVDLGPARRSGRSGIGNSAPTSV